VDVNLAHVAGGLAWPGFRQLPAALLHVAEQNRSNYGAALTSLFGKLNATFHDWKLFDDGRGLLNNLLVLRLADPRWKYLWYFPSQVPGADSVGGWLLLTQNQLTEEEVTLVAVGATLFFQDIAAGLTAAEAKRADEASGQVAGLRTGSDWSRAILHDSNSRSGELVSFLSRAQSRLEDDEALHRLMRRLSYYAGDTIDLYLELREAPDALTRASESAVYPSCAYPERAKLDIAVEAIRAQWKILAEIASDRAEGMTAALVLGARLLAAGRITNLNDRVLYRILANLLANSAKAAALGRVRAPTVRLRLDIRDVDGRSYLAIRAVDNGGGFKLEGIPPRITVADWMAFRERTSMPGGFGFLFIARYADATNGSFLIRNVGWRGGRGVMALVYLGLRIP
jgi:hypothetical protein